jgi:hypothetical protein
VFDPNRGGTIFVGSSDPGDTHLFRSYDNGATWSAVSGQPRAEMLPAKAEMDDAGILYVTYGNGIGPNGVTDGAVWKLNTKTGEWSDITPEKGPTRKPGGYFGLSLDRQHPGTLAVATMNHWSPIDTVWRSTDGGPTWKDIAEQATRDVSLSPYLYWGQDAPKLGWWMSALAIDPFDSDHAAYATGATVYATSNFSNTNRAEPTNWSVWADGIEETAVITLLSPRKGAHLLSGFGDIGGFVHDDLDASPRQGMYTNPLFGNTTTLDCAETHSNVIVRSGAPHDGQAPLGWSEDGGRTWRALASPASAAASAASAPATPPRRRATPAIVVSADGSTFMLMSRTPMLTRDRGASWTPVTGLPPGARPVPDRLDPQLFYALDFSTSQLYRSTDAGATFAPQPSTGLPADIHADAPTWHEAAWPLVATLGQSGDLWLVSKTGLFHSTDRGATFKKLETDLSIDALSFGKSAPGNDYPSLFAIGTSHGIKAIWRSDDVGANWTRINDDEHQYGTRFRCISGDPRIFGRVYVGTDGRGIFYADPIKGAAKQ